MQAPERVGKYYFKTAGLLVSWSFHNFSYFLLSFLQTELVQLWSILSLEEIIITTAGNYAKILYIKESCLLLVMCSHVCISYLFILSPEGCRCSAVSLYRAKRDFTEGTGEETTKTKNKAFSQSLGITFIKTA